MKSDSRIKQLFQNTGLAILEVDQEARVRYLNRGAERLLGVEPEDTIGMRVWEFLKGKKQEFQRLVSMMRQHPNGLTDVPVRVVSNGIRSLWAEVCITPFQLTPEDRGYLIFLKDITHRKIADDRVKETTNILINILNDSADAIMGITLDNRIFLWNRGAENIFDYTAEEMQDQPVEMLIPDDLADRKELAFFTREALAKGVIQNYVTDRIRKDGQRITVNITRTVIRDSGGKEVGFSAIVRDITQQLKLQHQVIQSERLSVVGRMAAQVAHEIRNPLSSIMLNLELVQDELEEMDEKRSIELRHLMRTIETEVDHLSNLTDDYLSFVRMPTPKRKITSPYNVIEEVAALIHGNLVDAGLSLDVRKLEVPPVCLDPNQIRRAVMNILKNAIEASGPGDTIRIWCSRSRDRRHLMINIRDFGTGIPTARLEQIFDLFYTTKLTGSGLGMHITRQILREHGGDVDVFSKPDQGTLVRLKLPLGGEPC